MKKVNYVKTNRFSKYEEPVQNKTDKLHQYLSKVYQIMNSSFKSAEAPNNSPNERLQWGIVIEGSALRYVLEETNLDLFIELTQYCSSVLCCRMSPSQKASVVTAVKKKLNCLTLAVG